MVGKILDLLKMRYERCPDCGYRGPFIRGEQSANEVMTALGWVPYKVPRPVKGIRMWLDVWICPKCWASRLAIKHSRWKDGK